MLKQMRLTTRQKKGDVQHLLARSFSRRDTLLNSPSQELSFPVPQFQRSPSPTQTDDEKKTDQVSIDELSIEPRVIGPGDGLSNGSPSKAGTTATLSPTDVIIDQSHLDVRSSRHSSPAEEAIKKERKESLSDSDSDDSVHTPLLETKPAPQPSTLPTNVAPGIQKYDEMFAPKQSEDEIPLGGSAENLRNQP